MAEALRESIRAEFNQQLQATVREFRSEITRLETELAVYTRLFAQAPATANTSRPKPCLQHVDKFSGTMAKWDTWHTSIKAKLRVDGTAIGSPEAQFWYVYNCLELHIQASILPHYQHSEEHDS